MGTFSLGKMVGLIFVWATVITPTNMDDGKATMKKWGNICVHAYGGIPTYELSPMSELNAPKLIEAKMGIVYCRKPI